MERHTIARRSIWIPSVELSIEMERHTIARRSIWIPSVEASEY